jgi:hypothetical protein
VGAEQNKKMSVKGQSIEEEEGKEVKTKEKIFDIL